MEEQYLTLKQNLCSARIFLNTFGLFLENPKEINEFSKIKIFNNNNLEVGVLYFENGMVKIQSITSLGNLNAKYEIATFKGFKDLEYDGAYVYFNHVIQFQVDGKLRFSGDIQIDVSMDTHFGKTCRVHSKIKYVDQNNNDIVLKFMDDGKPFSYEAQKEGFIEVLEINPWNDFESYMYHIIRNGEYDYNNHCFPDESIKFVWHNGDNDRNHLRTISHIIKKSQTIQFEEQIYESLGKKNSIESTIQKGLLMQQIDTDFSKKIAELISLFKKDNVSFFTNLINITFNNVKEAERKALFGLDIERINYHNGANNLLEAYFGIKENNMFLSQVVSKKTLKK